MLKTKIIVIAFILMQAVLSAQTAHIVISKNASQKERYAAQELQRYLYQLFGQPVSIGDSTTHGTGALFLVGRIGAHRQIDRLAAAGQLAISPTDPGAEGYALKTVQLDGRLALAIAGCDEVGVLYGVYGLLDDHYGVSFSLTGDVVPAPQAFHLPDIDERNAPTLRIRGFLPWTNFPQSATVYSWQDYTFIIDQMAKLRMNLLHIHNYNGHCGHNEMFHNFSFKGYMSRVWMATARSGHAWGGPGWDVNEYRFGASDLFDDYDFGADCALYNERLSNAQVYAKGVSLFQRVIDYAHSRGVKVGLGLDIDFILPEYIRRGATSDHPDIIAAQTEQVIANYPNLDYLICFHSETPQEDPSLWGRIFKGMYQIIKERQPSIRLAVAGWGLKQEFAADLPKDVICAPISAYSAGFETGAIYGDREYWGCPWLERDFNSSQYYYPYTMHLADTIKAYRNRAPNMTGMYTLTWRLGDAVDPKMIYIAKAPWDKQGKYATSATVYREYAQRRYGAQAADAVVSIIDNNEPFACGKGECESTPKFDGKTGFSADGSYLFNLLTFTFYAGDRQVTQFNAVDYTTEHGTQKADSGQDVQCVGFINSGDWIEYKGVDLGQGVDRLVVRAASASGGGQMELRLHNQHGRRLGEFDIHAANGWLDWREFEFKIDSASGKQDLVLHFLSPEVNAMPKANQQLEILDNLIAAEPDSGHRRRLGELRCRIAAVRDFITLQHTFPTLDWKQMPGAFDSWARNFTHRVNDISSLGNVQSSQNRFVQLRYLPQEQRLAYTQTVCPPLAVTARGTTDGAVITWNNSQLSVRGFNVYRDGKKITPTLLDRHTLRFTDNADGVFTYTVTAVDQETRRHRQESAPSLAVVCAAGSADKDAPHIVVVSPPTSVAAGQPLQVKARVLDGRVYDAISAVLYYRRPGQPNWNTVSMQRRAKAVFCGEIAAAALTAAGVEYYIQVSDGTNTSVFPAAAPQVCLTAVVTPADHSVPKTPRNAAAEGCQLVWKPADDQAHWYRIYRSAEPDFTPSAANFLTYVAAETTRFEELGEDFTGRKLNGKWYYRMTAVSKSGGESAPTEPIAIIWN